MLVRIGILVVALVVAVAVGFYAYSFIQERAERPPIVEKAPTVEVLVAARDLPAGKVLLAGELEGDLRWQEWPENAIAGDWIVRRGDGGEDPRSQVSGMMVKRGIVAGEPITQNRLLSEDAGAFLAGAMSPGMRPVTLSINSRTSNAGFIQPGSRVDVLLTQQAAEPNPTGEGTRRRVASEVILSDLKVLAIDQVVDDLGGIAKVGKTATIEVTPKQLEKINVAQELGSLSLALRPLRDPDSVRPDTAFTQDREVSEFLTRETGTVPPILTARVPVPAGTILTDAHLRWAVPPEGLPLEGLLTRGSFNEAGLRGSLLLVDIGPGEPIKQEDIIRPGTQGFLTTALGHGLRAVSVAVDDTSAVSGYISPGDRVDVILNHQLTDEGTDPPLNPRKFSEIILRDVRVLAIEQSLNPSTGKPELGATATLEVTPKQAEIVFVAVSMGSLALVLKRQEAEDDIPQRDRAYTSDLEVSRAAWDLIRGINRYGPGEPPAPVRPDAKSATTIISKPEVTLAPPPTPSPAPALAPSPRIGTPRTGVKVYRGLSPSSVSVGN